jgi:hypothetical protein
VSAAQYVAAQGDTAFQEAAAERVVTEWGRFEPAKAAAWVQATFEDPGMRAPSYRALAAMWLPAYPQAASAWIDSLPEGTDRDSAVDVLLENLAASDPETAAAWADTLSDLGMRESWKEKLDRQ